MKKGNMTKEHKAKLAESRRKAALKRREGMISEEDTQEKKKPAFQVIGYSKVKGSYSCPVFASEKKFYPEIFKTMRELKNA